MRKFDANKSVQEIASSILINVPGMPSQQHENKLRDTFESDERIGEVLKEVRRLAIERWNTELNQNAFMNNLSRIWPESKGY